jgi:hypothetical protein
MAPLVDDDDAQVASGSLGVEAMKDVRLGARM